MENIHRGSISVQKEWKKPHHKWSYQDNKDFHLQWSSSSFRKKIWHCLGIALSAHNSKQFMSTFFFFISSGIWVFFSFHKKCQLWSTCSRHKICTLQHYWYVASTISCILVNLTGKRKSYFFSSFSFRNKTVREQTTLTYWIMWYTASCLTKIVYQMS